MHAFIQRQDVVSVVCLVQVVGLPLGVLQLAVAVVFQTAVGHRVRLNAEEGEFLVECSNAVVARKVDAAGTVVR